ncbi:multiubiquitin domain-containing protein [Desulfosporosinus sp. FKB]|uniref:multiubiquitin domain-containing protein n=1 Tax=Desulfosporosinus sp. FKB TaxID=1969835 RepID=UPI000B49BF13|nr:multiubiquitin domain-containing protein [Desulfosporosinus sp. FKB]MCO5384601.1 multiubiquitin domain-containing protein [Desulfosporosinus sp.]
MSNVITVIINGQPVEVEKRSYSFQEVITLAFGSYDDSQKSYTMVSTRKNDDGDKHKISYSLGDQIKMKDGMRINVDSTNRS